MLKRRRLIRLIMVELRAMRHDATFVPTCRDQVEAELGRRLGLKIKAGMEIKDGDIDDLIELIIFIINLIISLFFATVVEDE